jgi:predicted transcriptional regulator
MPKPKPRRPTDAELEILRVLWEKGPCSVRQVQQVLSQSRDVGYTTVLKLLQIMTEKELVLRDESKRSHVYRSRLSQDKTQRQLVRDLIARAFGGSAEKLVMQALSAKKVSQEELADIREFLDELEER